MTEQTMSGSSNEQPKCKRGPGPLRRLNRETGLFGSVRSLIGQAGEGASRVQRVLTWARTSVRLTLLAPRKETFEQAMRRLNVGIDELPYIHNQLAVESLVTVLMASIALLAAILFGFEKSLISAFMLSSMTMVACLCRSAYLSFRAFQVRSRKLGRLLTWASSPREWLPGLMTDHNHRDDRKDNR